MSIRVRLVSPIIVFAIVTLLLWTPPATALDQTVGLMQYNDSASFSGYTLFSPMRTATTYLIDNYGRQVHSWASAYQPSLSVYLTEDGYLLRSIKIPGTDGAEGGVQKIAWDGTVVWEYVYASADYYQHHDIEPLPNGNVLLLAQEHYTAAEAIAAGRDPNQLTDDILSPEHIVEVMPTGPTTGDIVWEWRAWDHLIQDYDAGAANYGVVENHPELIDMNYMLRTVADWIHLNAIEYNEELDQIVMSSKPWCEVWVIDHSATTLEAAGHTGGNQGMGGDLLYRWGNPEAYRSGELADRRLFGPHDIQWIKPGLPGEGNLLVYNNGVSRPEGEYSTIEEVVTSVLPGGSYPQPDSGVAHGPAEALWTYAADPPTSMYSARISGCQRLPNGNTLICVGKHGRFLEVTPDGEAVWHYQNPVGASGPGAQGDASVLGTVNTFRCARYAADYPGLVGRDLTPGAPIEISPVTITDVDHAPELPLSSDSVIVTASVVAAEGVASVSVYSDAGTGFLGTTMYDDGLHHDGAADDGVFGAAIAPQPAGTQVAFYVQAEDQLAEIVTDPVFAPTTAVYHYLVDPTSWVCGDIDNNGALDIGDLVYLVNYMFQAGPPPPIPDAANIDGVGGLDIADLVYLVNYMFQAGPPPQC